MMMTNKLKDIPASVTKLWKVGLMMIKNKYINAFLAKKQLQHLFKMM
jgi:hypothetical protein